MDYEKPESESKVMHLRRRLCDGDLYVLASRRPRVQRIEMRLRIKGQRPELWHADTGKPECVSWRAEGMYTGVPLIYRADESVFVSFREPTSKRADNVPEPKNRVFKRIGADWRLSFELDHAAPKQPLSIAFGCRTKSEWYELAQISLKDNSLGTTWCASFGLDITEALRPGGISLIVRVANLSVNRWLGDQPPGAVPVTFTITQTYRTDASLRPSGLVGSATLKRRARYE